MYQNNPSTTQASLGDQQDQEETLITEECEQFDNRFLSAPVDMNRKSLVLANSEHNDSFPDFTNCMDRIFETAESTFKNTLNEVSSYNTQDTFATFNDFLDDRMSFHAHDHDYVQSKSQETDSIPNINYEDTAGSNSDGVTEVANNEGCQDIKCKICQDEFTEKYELKVCK